MVFLDEARSYWPARQDRIRGKTNTDYIKVKGKFFPVMNFDSFGLLIRPGQLPQGNITGAEFYSFDMLISKIDLKYERSFNDPESGELLEAFSVVGQVIRIEKILSLRKSDNVKIAWDRHASLSLSVPEIFRFTTYEIKSGLFQLKLFIETPEYNPFEFTRTETEEYENFVCEDICKYMIMKFAKNFLLIDKLIVEANGDARKRCVEFFSKEVEELIFETPYPVRSLEQPGEYAECTDWRISTRDSENREQSLFSKCLQKFFLKEPAAMAVRNRVHDWKKNLYL